MASERTVATSTPASSRASKDTISSSPQKEHYQGCLKLYAENVRTGFLLAYNITKSFLIFVVHYTLLLLLSLIY